MLKTKSETHAATKPAERLALCVFHKERFREIELMKWGSLPEIEK